MRCRVFVMIVCLAGTQIQAHAFDKGLGLEAPTVDGKANVGNPVEGEIVYDISDDTFYGRQSAGWTAFGGSGTFPAGIILAYGGTTVPSGYLLCDGSAVSRTAYADLYAAVGNAFGSGDGSTTFNLPDFRGRFLRGLDGTAGIDPDKTSRTAMNSGGNTGNNVGSVQNDAFQGHYHTVTGSNISGFGGSHSNPAFSSSTTGLGGAVGKATDVGSDGTNGTPRATSETRPDNAYVNFIIKI